MSFVATALSAEASQSASHLMYHVHCRGRLHGHREYPHRVSYVLPIQPGCDPDLTSARYSAAELRRLSSALPPPAAAAGAAPAGAADVLLDSLYCQFRMETRNKHGLHDFLAPIPACSCRGATRLLHESLPLPACRRASGPLIAVQSWTASETSPTLTATFAALSVEETATAR